MTYKKQSGKLEFAGLFFICLEQLHIAHFTLLINEKVVAGFFYDVFVIFFVVARE